MTQSRQGCDRGAQESLALQILRAEPRPTKEESSLPRGTQHFLVNLTIVGNDGVGSKDSKPGKEGGYRPRSETKEEKRMEA